MTFDSAVSISSLLGCAVLGLTPSMLGQSDFSLSQGDAAYTYNHDIEEMRELSVVQTQEVSELRDDIEELQMLVNHRRSMPSHELPGYPACGFDGCTSSTGESE